MTPSSALNIDHSGSTTSRPAPLSLDQASAIDPEAQPFLQDVDSCLAELCAQANHLDQDPKALRNAFFGLGTRSLLGLKAPKQWGGRQLPAHLFFQFQEQIAQHSGALAFLQTQHQSAVSKLAQSPNAALKEKYLREAIQGTLGIGVGFSQLRRSGPPLVHAVPTETGYRISGQVPWITGYGCFKLFILGATLPDGRAVFGLLPLETTKQSTGGQLQLSPPLDLAAMMSTNTVTATLNKWHIPERCVLEIKPGDWIHRSDRRNTLNHSFFALGCARAGLTIVANVLSHHPTSTMQTAWTTLDQQLIQCRQGIYQAQLKLQSLSKDAKDNEVEYRYQLRAMAIDLAVRCTHAAVIVSKGAANILSHPAQRVYREALAFSVFGQTQAVMDASLAQLVHPSNR